MAAKLPKRLITRVVAHMKEGDTGYVVPWAIEVDVNLNCYIKRDFPVMEKPAGTCTARVWLDSTGYHANVGGCGDYRWAIDRYVSNDSIPLVTVQD